MFGVEQVAFMQPSGQCGTHLLLCDTVGSLMKPEWQVQTLGLVQSPLAQPPAHTGIHAFPVLLLGSMV
jgi:hypothetical protein